MFFRPIIYRIDIVITYCDVVEFSQRQGQAHKIHTKYQHVLTQ